MNRCFNPVVILLLLLVGLSSCSMTKRKYLGGYHIEWKHKATYSSMVVNEKRNEMFSTRISPKTMQIIEPPGAQDRRQIPSFITKHFGEGTSKHFVQVQDKMNSIVESKVLPADTLSNGQPAKIDKTLANTSLTLGLVAIIMPFVLTPLGYALYPPGADDSTLAGYIAACVILWFIASLVGFICGIRALHKIHNSPAFGGRASAIAGIILCSIALILPLIFIGVIIVALITSI